MPGFLYIYMIYILCVCIYIYNKMVTTEPNCLYHLFHLDLMKKKKKQKQK